MIPEGRACFFLGAGASLQEAPEEPFNEDPDRPPHRRRLPTAQALAGAIAEKVGSILPDGAGNNLLEITSYFEAYFSRRELVDVLGELLDDRHGPGEIHRFLAEISLAPPRQRLTRRNYSHIILTTNYDRFIERALDAAGCKYHLVVNVLRRWSTNDKVRFLWVAPGGGIPSFVGQDHQFDEKYPLVFKIHGSLGMPEELRDTFVISEEDYYEMAGREHDHTLFPYEVQECVSRASIIFLGYALRDIHLRHALLTAFSNAPHFLFNKMVSEFQKRYWLTRNVRGFECDCGTFAQSMRVALREEQSVPNALKMDGRDPA